MRSYEDGWEEIKNDQEIAKACLLREISPGVSIEFLKVYFTRTTVSLQVTAFDKFLGLFSKCCCLENQADSHALWGPTCSIVASRVIKFQFIGQNTELANTLICFDTLALEWFVTQNQFIQDEISDVFVNSLVPQVRTFFTAPKLYWFGVSMKEVPKENKLLADFVMFLLQLLDSEASIGRDEQQRYGDFKKELTILYFYLNDNWFWGTKVEGINKLLADSRKLVNEAGKFVYSFVFTTRRVKILLFYAGKHSILREFKHMNANMQNAVLPGLVDSENSVEGLRILLHNRVTLP